MIELQGLTKSYSKGSIKAVDSLNLKVEPGEIFGFLGPNGAGKTTTIKMMVGLLKPDAGSAKILGYDIQKEPLKVKERMGFVPDRPEVYEKLTGIEYLNFLGDVYQVEADVRQKRILNLLEAFQMEKSVQDLIQSYSHGMRQKIVLIGALLHNPDLILMDEPMVGLDPKSSHMLKEMMRKYCRQGKTMFFSTHILDVAERFCDRIGIIHNGALIASGTMEHLQSQAQNKETLENIFLELTE